MKNTKTQKYLLIIAIIFLGLGLRVFNIENVPSGVYPDEGVNGEDALLASETGEWSWFYTANNGREGLFINLIAIFFKIFSVSIFSLKLPSIIFGTLTIWGTYLLTREIFKKENIALVSSFLVATSFWAINFSRIGFRAIMLPAVLTFAFYFLWRGLRTKRFQDFAWGGLIFGVGLHTYIAFRIAPLILVFTLIFLIWERKDFLKIYWKKIIIFILFCAISAAPMLITFFAHPEYLESRSASISVLSPEVNEGHLIKTFLTSLGFSLVKYNFWGDQNWRHNFPPYPILNPVVGIFFLIALFYFLISFLKDLYRKIFAGQKKTNLALGSFVLGWFFLMLAPEFMTAEGLPHALRALGTLPIVYVMASFGIFFALEKTKNKSDFLKNIMPSVIIVLLIFVLFFNALKYHVFWAQKKEVAISFDKKLINIVDYTKTVSNYKEKFIITGSMQRVPVKLLAHDQEYISYFYPQEISKINPKNPNYFEIIMTDKDDNLIKKLKERFGNMDLEEEKDQFGISFYILKK